MIENIEMLVMDVDGTLTDGKIITVMMVSCLKHLMFVTGIAL